jgi:SPW repeat
MQFITPRVHSIIGFIVGVALLFAPNIFGFSDVGGAAVAIPRILGVIVILSELTVRGSFSGAGFVSMRFHIWMDVIMGIFLAASPWLFGFADEEVNAWVPHLVVGIAMVGYALATNPNVQNAKENTAA